MRSLFYNHTSVISGAEINMLQIARHMPECEVIICAPAGELLERAKREGLKTLEMPAYNARIRSNPLLLLKDALGLMVAALAFARRVRKMDVDIVHANSIRAGLIASSVRWLHRKPVIWHIQDHVPGGLIGKIIMSFMSSFADAVIGISRSVLSPIVQRMGRKSAYLIHNGQDIVERSDTEKQQARKRVREELQTGEHHKVLVIIGQIALWKRQEDAIRAAARLAAERKDVKLWVVGEAKFRAENERYREHLKELAEQLGIAEHVVFTGFRQDIVDICCAADMLLLCSENEPFGLVLTEAMSQGLPVIATDGGGVPEIVEHGVSGFLYRTGDIDDLLRYARTLLDDEQLRHRLGEQASLRVRQHFHITRTARKVKEVYDRVHGQEPAARERICIVHDYLIQMGGAERVVAALHRLYPKAPIYTTVVDHKRLIDELKDADIRTSWMQRIPGIKKHFKLFFWLYPFAVRSWPLRGYDLIISSSSAYAKGIAKPKGARHITYCHTPMRFAWDYETYIRDVQLPHIVKRLLKLWMKPLRWWDTRTAREVDLFIANSTIVRDRIERCYNRSATVVHPPAETHRFSCLKHPPEPYFLVVSRLVSYKRIDIAVEACSRLGLSLVVIGEGPDRARLESLAGPSVKFLGRLSDSEVIHYMQRCRALLFPGLEDFGITPLEANACGRPVIAYRGGGALDTVKPGVNGLFFAEQHADSLAEVLRNWDDDIWDSERIRGHAERFGVDRFSREIRQIVEARAWTEVTREVQAVES